MSTVRADRRRGRTEQATKKGPERASIDPHQGRRAWMLIAPTIILLGVVIGYPILRAIWMSLQKDATVDPATGLFVEGGFAGFDNYTRWLFQQCGDRPARPAPARPPSGRSSGSPWASRS